MKTQNKTKLNKTKLKRKLCKHGTQVLCCVAECKTNTPSASGTKRPTSKFPEFSRHADKELSRQWERFVNRKNWMPTKFTRICLNHFDDRFTKIVGTKKVLMMDLKPIPTIHTDTVSPPSLPTPNATARPKLIRPG